MSGHWWERKQRIRRRKDEEAKLKSGNWNPNLKFVFFFLWSERQKAYSHGRENLFIRKHYFIPRVLCANKPRKPQSISKFRATGRKRCDRTRDWKYRFCIRILLEWTKMGVAISLSQELTCHLITEEPVGALGFLRKARTTIIFRFRQPDPSSIVDAALAMTISWDGTQASKNERKKRVNQPAEWIPPARDSEVRSGSKMAKEKLTQLKWACVSDCLRDANQLIDWIAKAYCKRSCLSPLNSALTLLPNEMTCCEWVGFYFILFYFICFL